MTSKQSDERTVRRRTIIGTVGGLVLGGLSGCTGSTSDTGARTGTETKTATATPTRSPTDTPTATQTREPTDTPTEEPTDTPTEEPTETSTAEPTDAPTEEPTDTPTETQTPEPSSNYPSYSGTQTISGDDDYWSFELDISNDFVLEYTVTNQKSHDYDFDAFIFDRAEYKDYLNKVQGGDANPDAINDASVEGVQSSAQTEVGLYAGQYYFVVDNTDIGDAGDVGHEETRSVEIDLETRAYS
ncbi:hypothetical protein [Halopelagius longus]|uniref:Uncharacterized protein n=1 Tax=Halopelagius longus TaxID=1236180 RepID=A0A1H1BIP7_9EURY|nr:hypothetical protein [Halopelagius longus]SDQ51650.1 hypothetical protein SAMN05216278_1808 [Halopelagius longus]